MCYLYYRYISKQVAYRCSGNIFMIQENAQNVAEGIGAGDVF